MRLQILEVPGGKPILVISENPGAKDFELDMSDEDRFLERCGLGGVIVSEHSVFLDSTPYMPVKPAVPGDKPVGGLDEWRRSLPTIRPQVTCAAFGQYPAPVMSKCDGTCAMGAGCGCDA